MPNSAYIGTLAEEPPEASKGLEKTVRRRRRAFFGITLSLGLTASLATAEMVLRSKGYQPWRDQRRLTPPASEPLGEPDPVLGWQNKRGHHTTGPYVSGGEKKHVHILPDGSRATSSGPVSQGPLVVMVGGSFTLGQGLSDDETLAWRLQTRRPDYGIVNYGGPAYGTYQSLLILERLFRSERAARIVIYGFIENHEMRNVGRPGWIRALNLFARREVKLPYCDLSEDGSLVRVPPHTYPAWPLRDWLGTVDFLEINILNFTARQRVAQKGRITQLLLLDMEKLCQANQATLVVVFLTDRQIRFDHPATFLRDSGVRYLDCRQPLTPELRVAGEGHPNAILNALWADCISEGVERLSLW